MFLHDYGSPFQLSLTRHSGQPLNSFRMRSSEKNGGTPLASTSTAGQPITRPSFPYLVTSILPSLGLCYNSPTRLHPFPTSPEASHASPRPDPAVRHFGALRRNVCFVRNRFGTG